MVVNPFNWVIRLMSTSASADHKTASVVVEQLKGELREDFLAEQVLMISMICFRQDVFQTFIYAAFKYFLIYIYIYIYLPIFFFPCPNLYSLWKSISNQLFCQLQKRGWQRIAVIISGMKTSIYILTLHYLKENWTSNWKHFITVAGRGINNLMEHLSPCPTSSLPW